MDMLKKTVCLLVLCMVLISPYAEASITCGQVSKALAPCINYLQKGGAVPPGCCGGIRGLNSAAKTTPDRQAACRCLVSASKSIKGINPIYAQNLPRLCGISIPYKISPNTDCSKVQ